MSETLFMTLTRAKDAVETTAQLCRERAGVTADKLVAAALEGFAGQLDDRAAQLHAWMGEALEGVSPARETAMRAACAEWLRMAS